MPNADVYRITDQLDDTTLGVMVARLESRGKHPRFMAMMEQYLAAMGARNARRVLDLGCGTGVAARAIASDPGFSGQVIGIDVSPFLTAEAARLAAEEGLAAKVEFRVGNSQQLDLPDSSVDAAIAHTLISHVLDPLAVLKEMARVVRPGGTVGIFDGDYASMTFGNPDAVQGKVDDESIIKAIVTSPRVMRQMPHLLREAGLELVSSHAHVVADIGKADFFAPALQSFLRLLPKSGAMNEPAARSWVDAMMARSEEGTFFGASNFYSYVARRR